MGGDLIKTFLLALALAVIGSTVVVWTSTRPPARADAAQPIDNSTPSRIAPER